MVSLLLIFWNFWTPLTHSHSFYLLFSFPKTSDPSSVGWSAANSPHVVHHPSSFSSFVSFCCVCVIVSHHPSPARHAIFSPERRRLPRTHARQSLSILIGSPMIFSVARSSSVLFGQSAWPGCGAGGKNFTFYSLLSYGGARVLNEGIVVRLDRELVFGWMCGGRV